jgi:hypothetical protein
LEEAVRLWAKVDGVRFLFWIQEVVLWRWFMRRGLRDVQSFCDRREGESLGVRNLEKGNTKLSLKDVQSLCSGGVDFRGVVCYDCKVGEAVER